MGLGTILKILGAAGAAAAVPLTGGASLTALPTLLAAGAGGLAGLGGALTNTKGARTGTQNSTSTTTFTEPPAYASMGDLLRKRITDRLNSTYDLSGYESNGLTGINDAFSGLEANQNADLTARGLATSPVAATAGGNLRTERGSQIVQFLNSLPDRQRAMQGEDLSRAQAFYAARPLSTTTTQSGTNVQPGTAVGGALTSMASMLAYLQRQRQLSANPPGAIIDDWGHG